MRRTLSILIAVALLGAAATMTGCVSDEAPNGDENAASGATVGYPQQAQITQAFEHARQFWTSRLDPPSNVKDCAWHPSTSPYNGPTDGFSVGISAGCGCTQDNYQPCKDASPPYANNGEVGFNINYSWNYARLCVVVVHEMGHLIGFVHNNVSQSSFDVMDKPPTIGNGACPTG